MRAIDHLHAWYSLVDIHNTIVKCPFQSSRRVPAENSRHTYFPHTSTPKFSFDPLIFQVAPMDKIHPTPSSQSVCLKAVRYKGFWFDPSRCSSFCSTIAVPLASGSIIHHSSSSVLPISLLYQGQLDSPNESDNSTANHLSVLDISPPRKRDTSRHPSSMILSFPPLRRPSKAK